MVPPTRPCSHPRITLPLTGPTRLPAGLVAPIRLTGLTPGVARTVTVTLPGVVTNLPAGDRLVLEVATTDLAYQLPSSPRSYTIALSGSTVAVATIDGRILRAGQPWIWLVTGLAAMAILILGALVAAVRHRRRRRRTVLAELSSVPVAIEDLVKEYGDGYRAVDGVSFRVERGTGRRAARSQRCRQDHHVAGADGPDPADVGHGARVR